MDNLAKRIRHQGLRAGLGTVQILIAVCAIIGGLILVADPSGVTFHYSTGLLRSTPFSNFLLPGLLLFAVIGLGNLVGVSLSFKNGRSAGWVAVLLGAALIVFITAQMYWFASIGWIQVVCFTLGSIELVLGLWLVVPRVRLAPRR